MIVYVLILAFFTCFSFIMIFAPEKKVPISDRLDEMMGKKVPIEPTKSVKDRLIAPIMKKVATKVSKIAPRGSKEVIQNQLVMASLDTRWTIDEWQGLKYGIGMAGAFIFLIIALFVPLMIIWRIEIVMVGFLISYLAPSFWLKLRGKARLEEINFTLPDILDLLTISIEAGLGFDSALVKVVEKGDGILTHEFMRVLQEIRLGRPRRDALRDLVKRNPSDDLKSWVAAIIQADQLGVSIGNVMRNQANQIRIKRRQYVQEQAQKAPVKIMVPLVVFIFPCVFVVVLGPAVIQLLDTFAGK